MWNLTKTALKNLRSQLNRSQRGSGVEQRFSLGHWGLHPIVRAGLIVMCRKGTKQFFKRG